MNTDPNCIFCKIVAREVPCARLLEDDAAMSFLDIGPLAQGHALLISREHYETLDRMPPEVAAAVLKHLPALAAAVQQATGCRGLNILQNNGRVAHQLVPHVHFHIIPRNPGDEFHFNWPTGTYPEGEMEQLAEAIRSKLP